MMPAVAYRIEVDGRSIVFSGDVSVALPPLVELARGCDLLVQHLSLPEREVPHGELHAKPSEVGRVAGDSGCNILLRSHFMPEIEDELDEAVDLVRRSYRGELRLATDLMSLAISP